MNKITSHAYDCGPVNTGGPCIAERGGGREAACGKFEYEHQYSEYVEGRNPGDMHEPPAYPEYGQDGTPNLSYGPDDSYELH